MGRHTVQGRPAATNEGRGPMPHMAPSRRAAGGGPSHPALCAPGDPLVFALQACCTKLADASTSVGQTDIVCPLLSPPVCQTHYATAGLPN